MWLIVGLGNPGTEYKHNRHNIGFMAVDEIIHRHNFSEPRKKFKALVTDGMIGKEKVLLLKPDTFMNLSGEAVQAAVAFYKIPMDHVIVFHDDLDLASGKMRMKFAGGAGGHNGLRSIDDHLGKNYWRARLGIGHPGHKERVTGHVLGNFSKDDKVWLEKILEAIGKHSNNLFDGKMDKFGTRIAEAMRPPKPPKVKEENLVKGLPTNEQE